VFSNQSYGYYNGQVLTMTSGPARGMSTRIVGYMNNGGTTGVPSSAVFRVMAFEGMSTADFVSLYNSGIPQRFLVSGRAFNGTGCGYNTSVAPTISGSRTTLLDATDPTSSSWYYALLPNSKYFQPTASTYVDPAGPGGANEDYDAPDPQNLPLAWQPVGVTLSSQIIPSYHRPDLCAWWSSTQNSAWTATPSSLARKAVMRPLPGDHPLFTGSNPNYPSNSFMSAGDATHQWDVDNDNDGIADSVWLDLGYPVQTTPDGKQYKPLFAY
jgi:hypothetical protein